MKFKFKYMNFSSSTNNNSSNYYFTLFNLSRIRNVVVWNLLLTITLLVATSGANVIAAASRRDINGGDDSKEWKIVFYTGEDAWAGTDAPIYFELIGELNNSPIFSLVPKKSQLEAGSVDIFSINMGARLVGDLKQIIVGRQHTYAPFNDWQLVKVEVYDPYGKRYVFKCNCWLTSYNIKRKINLSSTDILNDNSNENRYTSTLSARHSKIFPLTVFLLFLLLILILFSYFGNSLCKKWRENIIFLTTRTNGVSHDNRHSSRHIYRNQDQQVHIPLNTALVNTNSIIEDKPPDYKALFPNESNTNEDLNTVTVATTDGTNNTTTTTTTNTLTNETSQEAKNNTNNNTNPSQTTI